MTLRVGRLGSPATAQGLLRWGQGRLREGPCAGGGCLKPALVYHFLRPSPSEGWRGCTPPRRGSPRHCRLPPPRPAIRRGPRCRVVSRDTISGDVRPGLGSHDPCPHQPEGTRAHIAHQPVRRAGPPAGGCLRAASFTHSHSPGRACTRGAGARHGSPQRKPPGRQESRVQSLRRDMCREGHSDTTEP